MLTFCRNAPFPPAALLLYLYLHKTTLLSMLEVYKVLACFIVQNSLTLCQAFCDNLSFGTDKEKINQVRFYSKWHLPFATLYSGNSGYSTTFN